MTLLETLALGSYLYTTAWGVFLFKLVQRYLTNHVRHLSQKVDALEAEMKRYHPHE